MQSLEDRLRVLKNTCDSQETIQKILQTALSSLNIEKKHIANFVNTELFPFQLSPTTQNDAVNIAKALNNAMELLALIPSQQQNKYFSMNVIDLFMNSRSSDFHETFLGWVKTIPEEERFERLRGLSVCCSFRLSRDYYSTTSDSEIAKECISICEAIYRLPLNDREVVVGVSWPLLNNVHRAFIPGILSTVFKLPPRSRRDIVYCATPLLQTMHSTQSRLRILNMAAALPKNERDTVFTYLYQNFYVKDDGSQRADAMQALLQVEPSKRSQALPYIVGLFKRTTNDGTRNALLRLIEEKPHEGKIVYLEYLNLISLFQGVSSHTFIRMDSVLFAFSENERQEVINLAKKSILRETRDVKLFFDFLRCMINIPQNLREKHLESVMKFCLNISNEDQRNKILNWLETQPEQKRKELLLLTAGYCEYPQQNIFFPKL